MGARQSTSVSKNDSVLSSRKRSAPISRTRNGALPVVSTSSATNWASSSRVRDPTSGASTAISSHGTGSTAPRGFRNTVLEGTCLLKLASRYRGPPDIRGIGGGGHRKGGGKKSGR